MEKEFTKADLKDGMVIETRERGRYLVLGNIATRNNGYNKLSRYGDDLTEHSFHNKAYDIVRVFKELKKQQSLSVHTWMKLFLKWKKLKKRK